MQSVCKKVKILIFMKYVKLWEDWESQAEESCQGNIPPNLSCKGGLVTLPPFSKWRTVVAVLSSLSLSPQRHMFTLFDHWTLACPYRSNHVPTDEIFPLLFASSRFKLTEVTIFHWGPCYYIVPDNVLNYMTVKILTFFK